MVQLHPETLGVYYSVAQQTPLPATRLLGALAAVTPQSTPAELLLGFPGPAEGLPPELRPLLGQLQPSSQPACLHEVLAFALCRCASPRLLYMLLTQIHCAVQVLFHLQTRSPPVLPPLCELFKQDADTLQARPLHAGQQPKEGVIEVS